jgi:heat shock protein HspQ
VLDDSGEPVRHPQIGEYFKSAVNGEYKVSNGRLN